MVKSIENAKWFGKTEMTKNEYERKVAEYRSQEVTCPDCGKTMPISEWPVFKSTGRPKRTCCKTTGWNNRKKYEDRQKMVDGELHFLCKACELHKPSSDFYMSKGLVGATCKKCHSERYANYRSASSKKKSSQAKIRKVKRDNELIECKACGRKIKRKYFPKQSSGKLAERCCVVRKLCNINKALRKRGLKFCNNCGVVKPLEHFASTSRGHVNYCKICKKAISVANQYNEKRANRIHDTDDGSINTETLKDLFIPETQCCVCGENMKFEDKTLDHITPLSLDGSHTLSNVMVMCHRCNSSKSNRNPKTWFESLSLESQSSVLQYFQKRHDLCEEVLK